MCLDRRSFCGLIGTIPLIGLPNKFVTALDVITESKEVEFYIGKHTKEKYKLNYFWNNKLFPIENKLKFYSQYTKMFHNRSSRLFIFWKPNLKEYSILAFKVSAEPRLIIQGNMIYKTKDYLI